MSLQKYQAFLSAVDHGSISAAATALGYTQSAVSRMIADLEQEWAVQLLHRSRSGTTLTAEGIQLLPMIRSINAGCHALETTIRELHGLQTGMVRVGTFTTVAECWIPGLMRSFGEQYPHISFKLVNYSSYKNIEEQIRRGKLDCGFVRLEAAADLDVHFLKQDQLAVVLPENHPFAKTDVFPVAQLANESLIKLRNDYEISHLLDGLPVRYEVSSDNTILSMVESGLGISVMHSLIAESNRHKVVWKPLDRTEKRDIAIATAKDIRPSAAAALFVDHVCKELHP